MRFRHSLQPTLAPRIYGLRDTAVTHRPQGSISRVSIDSITLAVPPEPYIGTGRGTNKKTLRTPHKTSASYPEGKTICVDDMVTLLALEQILIAQHRVQANCTGLSVVWVSQRQFPALDDRRRVGLNRQLCLDHRR